MRLADFRQGEDLAHVVPSPVGRSENCVGSVVNCYSEGNSESVSCLKQRQYLCSFLQPTFQGLSHRVHELRARHRHQEFYNAMKARDHWYHSAHILILMFSLFKDGTLFP